MQRAADVQPQRRIPCDATCVADRGGQPALHHPVDKDVIRCVMRRLLRVGEEAQQLIPELELQLVVQPPHHAHPDALDVDPRIQWTARGTDAELILGHQRSRQAEIRSQRVLPDPEYHVVGGRRRLLHLQKERQVQNRVEDQDRVEPRGVAVEGRVLRDVRVVVEELNEAKRDRDGELRLAPLPGPSRDGAVSRVKAAQARLLETQAAHADPAGVGEHSLGPGRGRAADAECHQSRAYEGWAHDPPRE